MFELFKSIFHRRPSAKVQYCINLVLTQEVERLREAIKTHRSQKADDRCIEDDDRLYEALGDGIQCDRRVGRKADMLANCARFIEQRCEAGGWPTYAQLEADRRFLQDALWDCLGILAAVRAESQADQPVSDETLLCAKSAMYRYLVEGVSRP